MKTAVSIPDSVYRSAEALARRLGVSRSRLYATAVSEMVARYQAGEVTARLDEVYESEPPNLDPAIAALQARSLPKDDW
jgi:hypothetical protein